MSSIYLDVNFSARRLCAGAIVRNYGGAAPDRPWRIDISVARGPYGYPPTFNTVQTFVIPAEQVIGPEGFATPCNEEDLIYVEENRDAFYTFDVLIDPNHELADLDRANNYSQVRRWWHEPATLVKYQSAKWELTGERPELIGSEPAISSR